jgi:signal transduction protein with GAF and PtsI domain
MPNNDQQIIRQISEIITQTPDIQQALQQAIHCLIESADAGAGGVFVIRPQDDRIVLYAAHGAQPGQR